MAAKLSDAEIMEDIRTRPTVPVWPHYGWAHSCGRNKAYQMAQNGAPEEFVRLGDGERKMVRAITAPLRRKLGIEV